MYSSENSGFDIKDIIVKILFLVFFVLILMWLYPKMPSLDIFYDRVYNENITAMKDAAVDYYTTERLPKNEGDISEMTLQKMFDLKLIVPFVDKDGKSCDTTNSYVQVTKDGDEYVMKVTLVCGKQNDYIVEYIGCHDVCPNNECDTKEDKTQTTTTTTTTNNNNNSNNNSGSTSTTTVTKYTIKVKATNGTVSSSSLTVKKGNTATTTVKPKNGYEYASVSCTNGQKAAWSNNKIKVTNVSKNATCTVKFTKTTTTDNSEKYTVKVAVVNGTSSDRSKEVTKNSNATFTITASTGYDITNTNVTCSSGTVALMNGSKLTVNNVTKDGSCVVTIGKTNYDKYTVKVQVVNGKSNVESVTVAPNSTSTFTITSNSNYSLTNATVSCGNGLNGKLSGKTLTVSNIKSSGSCVVVLKQCCQTATVAKTYYSTGYVSATGTFTYTLNLNSMPNNVDPSDVVATAVDIRPMETYSDFVNYVAAKKANEMTMVGGNNGNSVKYNTAATLQAHALTKSNFTTTAKSGCSNTVCSVVITNNVKNLNGVTPTDEVTLVNGKTATGLYYVPVKFIVTYKYEK